MQDSRGFTVDTLVKVPFHPHPLFFRILALDNSRNLLKVGSVPSPSPDPLSSLSASQRLRCGDAAKIRPTQRRQLAAGIC